MIKGTKKIKVKVDISEWGMGDWNDTLRESVEISRVRDRYSCGVELKFGELFDIAARKVVQEGLEAFFNGEDTFALHAREDGIVIAADDMDYVGASPEVVVPWGRIFWHGDPREAIRTWMIEQRELYELPDVSHQVEAIEVMQTCVDGDVTELLADLWNKGFKVVRRDVAADVAANNAADATKEPESAA